MRITRTEIVDGGELKLKAEIEAMQADSTWSVHSIIPATTEERGVFPGSTAKSTFTTSWVVTYERTDD